MPLAPTQSSSPAGERLSVGFIEPHLLRFGGIRRVVELANRLVRSGHDVTFYLPDHERLACTWMECRAQVKRIRHGYQDPLDVLVFNEETQWHLLRLFANARLRVFYALHYAKLYGKAGSWESIRTPVDLRFANSTWTADMVEAETGSRPQVLLGGINPDHFHPVTTVKKYPVLCVGDPRPWKGTDLIEAAVQRLGLPLERYAPKNLAQEDMAEEYARAEVFVVGSDFEGFGQPGLEALACGVPLVTTDNGGCRDYAVHEETALVVPPRDVEAMAEAIGRVREDAELASHLIKNGLEIVRERFDWDRCAEQFEKAVRNQLARAESLEVDLQPNLRSMDAEPVLSIVVLAWDQLHYTQRCVESIRQNTDVPYELILVDNGSEAEAAAYAEQAGDQVVLNPENFGFSRGMNQGLARARGRAIAFLNNDTVMPPGWASPLLETLDAQERAGIVVPGVTAAGNLRTVRQAPAPQVEVLAPFEAPPSAVVYVMDTDVMRRLGGWGEEYVIASAEDVDLCFKVWVNGLDVVFDQRVLVDHVAKGTAGSKLDDYEQVWAINRKMLLEKWTHNSIDVPRLDLCTPEEFNRNVQIARSVAGWMAMYFRTRDRVGKRFFPKRILRLARPIARQVARTAYRWRHRPLIRRMLAVTRRYPNFHDFMRRSTR